jgi:hypothetical protein
MPQLPEIGDAKNYYMQPPLSLCGPLRQRFRIMSMGSGRRQIIMQNEPCSTF